jgi:hypothetical protein
VPRTSTMSVTSVLLCHAHALTSSYLSALHISACWMTAFASHAVTCLGCGLALILLISELYQVFYAAPVNEVRPSEPIQLHVIDFTCAFSIKHVGGIPLL